MNSTGPKRFIAYYRVSTVRQGRSGLGLDGQKQAISSHLTGAKLISEFVEVESGRRSDRPRLAEALAACRLHRATLLIAKLDRLARNVAFVSNLMESGVEFEAVDFPQANRLTIHILSAVAEHEARMVSDRTKAALQAAKRRGVKLGGFRGRAGTAHDCARARAARTLRAERRVTDLLSVVEACRMDGNQSLRTIAAQLNLKGISAPRGGTWSASQVSRLLSQVSARPSVT